MVLHLWNPKWPAFVGSAKTRFSTRWKQQSLSGCAKSALLSVCQFSQNRLGEGKSPSPVSFSVFILAPDLSFDCARSWPFQKCEPFSVVKFSILLETVSGQHGLILGICMRSLVNSCSIIVKSDPKIELSLLLSTMNRIKQGTELGTERGTERRTERETERGTERRTEQSHRGLERSGKRSWERKERRRRGRGGGGVLVFQCSLWFTSHLLPSTPL